MFGDTYRLLRNIRMDLTLDIALLEKIREFVKPNNRISRSGVVPAQEAHENGKKSQIANRRTTV